MQVYCREHLEAQIGAESCPGELSVCQMTFKEPEQCAVQITDTPCFYLAF